MREESSNQSQWTDERTGSERELYLVRSREGGEDEFSGVRSTRVDGDIGTSSDNLDALLQV